MEQRQNRLYYFKPITTINKTMESKEYKCRKDYIMECAEFKGVPAFIEGRTYKLNENRTGKSELFIEHDLSEERFFDEYFEPVTPIQSPDADNTERGEVEEQCLKFFKKTLKKAGLREALNINDFGYSQIERDLVSGILAIASESNPTPPTLLNELRENADKQAIEFAEWLASESGYCTWDKGATWFKTIKGKYIENTTADLLKQFHNRTL